MSVCLVTIVSWIVTLCPNLEFWYFRGSLQHRIVKDNPKECSFRTKASFFLTMTWKLLNLSCLFNWSERLIWNQPRCTWIKSKYSYSSSTIIQYWRKTIYFSSLFKRTNGVMIAVRDINIPFTWVSYLNTKNFHSAIFITVQGFPLLLINWTMKMNLKLSFQKKRHVFPLEPFFFFSQFLLKHKPHPHQNF